MLESVTIKAARETYAIEVGFVHEHHGRFTELVNLHTLSTHTLLR